MSEDPTKLLPNDDLKLVLAQLQILIRQVETLTMQVAALEQRQAMLEDKVDRRLQETRPIWEAVLARVDRIDARLSVLGEEQKDIRRTFFGNTREFMRMNDELLDRIEKLERRDAA